MMNPIPRRDGNVRKKFSECEDAMLIWLVSQFGSLGWEEISRRMPNRNARQCRERWKHYLSVGFTDRPWTKTEDDLLLEKHAEYGPRWTKLSTFFHKRSDIQVKNRCLKLIKRREAADESEKKEKPANSDSKDVEQAVRGLIFDLTDHLGHSGMDFDSSFQIFRTDQTCTPDITFF
jgi:hypothetical protein